jgi:hypothetical protein
MFNKYSRKRKLTEFKRTLNVYMFMVQYFIYCKLLGYNWKTGRYDKKHIIGRFLYKELRVGTTLMPKEEVKVNPMSDPSGVVHHCDCKYTKKE